VNNLDFRESDFSRRLLEVLYVFLVLLTFRSIYTVDRCLRPFSTRHGYHHHDTQQYKYISKGLDRSRSRACASIRVLVNRARGCVCVGVGVCERGCAWMSL